VLYSNSVKLGSIRVNSGVAEGILRVGIAMEFVGHGAFGIITKAAWLPYFGVFGIPATLAWRLMPVVGASDICFGILTLFCPVRVVLLYMTAWGFITACLRPLSGEPMWELIERAANFGVLLAYLLLAGPGRNLKEWIRPIKAPQLTRVTVGKISWILRATVALLLIGHGGFGIASIHKQAWINYFSVLGINDASALVGWFEIALGVLVFVYPATGLLLFIFAWKVFTESLRLPVGERIWEFIERGGSYAAPMALLFVRHCASSLNTSPRDTIGALSRNRRSRWMRARACDPTLLSNVAVPVPAMRVNDPTPAISDNGAAIAP
jgi:hypothetical protein